MSYGFLDRPARSKALAQNVDPSIIDIIRQCNPAVADDLERATCVYARKNPLDEKKEDATAIDYSMLLDYEYNGKKLTPEELEFVIKYVGNGLRVEAVDKKSPDQATRFLTRPHVIMAMHEITKDSIRQFQVNPTKVVRELGNILDGNISDVAEITAAGIVIKDFSKLPRHITGAVAEIHETRNAQGTQIRIKMHDKLAAAVALSRIMGINAPDKVDVTLRTELDVRLSTALERMKKEPQTLEGECVKDDG